MTTMKRFVVSVLVPSTLDCAPRDSSFAFDANQRMVKVLNEDSILLGKPFFPLLEKVPLAGLSAPSAP